MFNLSPKWNFPSNNHSQIIGIADSGVEMFKGTPIKSLAREICQNSLDARLDNAHPARLEFETFTINPKTIPDSSNLEDAFERSRDFWKIQDSTQARNFFKRALKDMNANTIKCLRISDFNTSGLTGSRDEYNSPWCNLTKSSGASNKSGSNGGSFGIGKFAPFACSSLRTVFYSTYDVDNISASQGVARLTTFKNKKKETTQGIGFYGCDKNSPMYNQYSLNPYDEKRKDPWELTKFICESSDYIMHALERNTSNNPAIIRPFLSAIIDVRKSGREINTDQFGLLAKYLNLLGGIYMLDCLPEERIYEKIHAKALEISTPSSPKQEVPSTEVQ